MNLPSVYIQRVYYMYIEYVDTIVVQTTLSKIILERVTICIHVCMYVCVYVYSYMCVYNKHVICIQMAYTYYTDILY